MFTPQLLQTYKTSRSRLPINTWVNVVGKNLPQFAHDSDIYNPIAIQIKIAGKINTSNGNVNVSIAPYDSNWYSGLVGALEKMTNQKNLNVVNYLGNPIKDLPVGQLACLGECDIIDKSGQVVRLAKVVAPPMQLATNKSAQLTEWWNSHRDELSRQIAQELKGLNMAELAKATVPEGKIQQLIESYMAKNTLHDLSWTEFIKTFGKDATSVATISASILDSIRQSMVASENQVRNYHATDGIGSEAALWKRAAGGASKYKDDFTMYRDIVEDAVFHPMVGKRVVDGILYGVGATVRKNSRTHSTDSSKRIATVRKHNHDNRAESVDPVASYYKEYHYPTYGKLPGHVVEDYNKSFGKVETHYPGDADKVVEMFNLFTGRAVSRSKKASKKKAPQVGELIPISDSMPKLIPIGDSVRSDNMPKLIPIGDSMPKLIPIGDSVRSDNMPKLIPIGNNMPKLIPIGSSVRSDDMPNLMDFL